MLSGPSGRRRPGISKPSLISDLPADATPVTTDVPAHLRALPTTGTLATRLRVQAWLGRHPEILEEEIVAPLVIVGLPAPIRTTGWVVKTTTRIWA